MARDTQNSEIGQVEVVATLDDRDDVIDLVGGMAQGVAVLGPERDGQVVKLAVVGRYSVGSWLLGSREVVARDSGGQWM